jgi:hypothetical protein
LSFLLGVDDLASFPIKDGDVFANGSKVCTHGQQLHQRATKELRVVIVVTVSIPGWATAVASTRAAVVTGLLRPTSATGAITELLGLAIRSGVGSGSMI